MSRQKKEWIAVIDGAVNYVGPHKKTAENRLRGITADKNPAIHQVLAGSYKTGDKYGEYVEGEILPPENAQENQKEDEMARNKRNKPADVEPPQVEDKTAEEQPVPELDAGGDGNKADGSDTKGNKKTGTKKAKPWDKGQPHADFLRKQAAEIREIAGRLAELNELREAAAKTREDWIAYGDHLVEARRAIKSNNLFNKWLEEQGLLSFADRNTRTDAMWLAELPEHVLEQVPETIHAPKAIRAWFRERVNAIAETLNSHEGKLAEQIAILSEDDPVAGAFAKALQESDEKKGVAEDKRTLPAAIQKVQARKPRIDFADTTVEAAVEWLVQKIGTHPKSLEVGKALVAAIEGGALEVKEGDTGEEAETETEAEGETEAETDAEESGEEIAAE